MHSRPPVSTNREATLPEPTTQATRPARVFVGLKLAPDIARALVAVAQFLPRGAVRPVAADDIHLTLVPPWEEPVPATAIETLRLVAAKHRAFELAIRHVTYGPQPRNPRLLWAECTATDELLALQTALLKAYGRQNERPFRPHVTLARIRGNGRTLARRFPVDKQLTLTQRIDSVELYQSPPQGQRGYRILASAPLTPSAPAAAGA